jgi:hypothetical protein
LVIPTKICGEGGTHQAYITPAFLKEGHFTWITGETAAVSKPSVLENVSKKLLLIPRR